MQFLSTVLDFGEVDLTQVIYSLNLKTGCILCTTKLCMVAKHNVFLIAEVCLQY